MQDKLNLLALYVSLLICSAMVVFQAALALGAPLGRVAWGGQYETLPTGLRIGSVVSMAIYVYLILCILKVWGKNSPITAKIARLSVKVFGYFLIVGVLMNAISRSHLEAIIMAPTALALCLSLLHIAYRVK
jgi:hypothetical protein